MQNFDETELDHMIQTLAVDFLAEADETLQGLWDLLERSAAGDAPGNSTVLELRRQAHSLKGLGGSFGFPSITLISHRLEDCIDGQDSLDSHYLGHARSFIEALQDIVESKTNSSDEECALIVCTLPAKGAVDMNFQATSDHEILVVVPALVLHKAVEGQLHSRGYRVVTLK